MNRILGATIVVLAAVTLAGCASGPDTEKVDAYHTLMHAMPAYKNVSTAGLDKAAKGVCGIFKADQTTGWAIAVQGASINADEAQANILVQAAVAAYCPQYKDNIPANAK